MKKLLFFFLCISLWSCQEDEKRPSDLLNFVPPNTAAILSTDNLEEFSEELQRNTYLSNNKAFPLSSFFTEHFTNLEYISVKTESLLCFNRIGKKDVALTLISKEKPAIKDLSKIANKKVLSYTYDEIEVEHYTLEDMEAYVADLPTLHVVSTSKLVIENIIRIYNEPIPIDTNLKKIYAVANDSRASLFFNYEDVMRIYQDYSIKSLNSLKKFTDWSVLDLDVQEDAIELHGVTQTDPKEKRLLSLFKDINPLKSTLAEVVPQNATGYFSFTYDSFENIQDNLNDFHQREKKEIKQAALFESAQEIGIIYQQEKPVLIVNSIDPNITKDALLASQEVFKEFRGVPIYNYEHPKVFSETFDPLIQLQQLKYYTVVDHYFAFAETSSALENIIANFQNRTTWSAKKSFQNTLDKLSSESSMLIIGFNEEFYKTFSSYVKKDLQENVKDIKVSDFESTAIQFIYDTNFAHTHIISQKADAKSKSSGSQQISSIKTEDEISGDPFLFTNWHNERKQIVVQTNDNELRAYTIQGKQNWKKELDGKIIGTPKEIDIYNNGRIQLAFNTAHKFYIIDRNGNDVKPFPLNFKTPITQAVSVFDYANNSKYRFVIAQDNAVSMWNKDGKQVKGFKFSKTASTVSQSPKHIRIGNKDYIVVPEENGTLHILNRVGDTRVNVKEKIDFSSNDWYLYDNRFTSSSLDGKLIQISESGKVTQKNKNFTETNRIDATSNTLVSLSENELNIKGKEVKLDFGLYTAPKIFYLNNKIYIALTDTQASKVYIFDSQAELLPGFPVYGNSQISLENIDAQGSLEFIVKGEDNSVLLYSLN
ncbi:hypothetical protein ACFQ3R_06640 [Mesonia ostreae]|uniref:Uncharacterized protein n=1 Tax=Mesonia ostreae TaxID=861110 RepID=A0ABU2KGZ6_9FLAO|nr:hypothetical protein [Mesonia ostreae]MDT0293982.1 hypothetical protein [Mesonia ostreae]